MKILNLEDEDIFNDRIYPCQSCGGTGTKELHECPFDC